MNLALTSVSSLSVLDPTYYVLIGKLSFLSEITYHSSYR